MATHFSPITAENFQNAWKYIARKHRWAKKKELIRRVSVSLAQILYFFVFLVLALGIFYEMGGSVVRHYMDQIPQLGIWWRQLTDAWLTDAAGEVSRILRCAGALYLLPLGVVLLPVMAIVLFYHPRNPKRTGNVEQDARQLRVLAKHAQVYTEEKKNNTESTCAFFMGMLMIAFVLGLMLFAYADPAYRDEMYSQASSANWRCFLYGAAMFLCYRIINIPLKLALKALHFCYVPASIVTDTETYFAQVSEQTQESEAKEE